MRGALVGAFSAAAFYGIGQHFEGIKADNVAGKVANTLENGLTSAQFAGKIAAHAAVGGIASDLNGGKFGHGFWAAGVTQALGSHIDGVDSGSSFSVARVVVAAVVGGTVSKLTGGKFANGAVTGAFARAFNDELHKELPEDMSSADREVIAEELFDDAGNRARQLQTWIKSGDWESVKDAYPSLANERGISLEIGARSYVDEFRRIQALNVDLVVSKNTYRHAENIVAHGASAAINPNKLSIIQSIATFFAPTPPPAMRHTFVYGRETVDVRFTKR
ncbi:hypothetical protein [Echinimonas agarilytica]|uniref:Uncharacterized protein n=1 Tax=Echinimonas agarilytica TaxID=1215918 RepID=A0AA41W7L8_9GAMM|nr:hypothetical protein [Echinimonas agarilytica]MCM2680031.1 hypothetical protein [Echinimonas agarilytica]